MVELVPYPFGRLVSRMFRELDEGQAIFDLPRSKFFGGEPVPDLSVEFHGKAAATPLGPAAGPHSQMAQNIVLAWLGGSRIIELKTVQILDQLEIPRPCIDMHNVGYNVEWSQELRLEQSLEEYVKAAMLIEMLVASGRLDLPAGQERTIYDMSVGYDLAGIRQPRVQSFIAGMMDASAVIDRLRAEIPAEYREFRDLDYPRRLADTLTLSTFHGCPPDEIEKIIDYLLRDLGLHCVIKLNPTLLGRDEVRRVLHDVLGYTELHTPDTAFDQDTQWPQAVAFVERLRATAAELGLGLGVKLTNTLIVDNHRDFLPSSQPQMYLSGPPLHVLAMCLVARVRRQFGAAMPVSFSAGIDRFNFADAVALGLTPITVCTDLLKTGGYARQRGYLDQLQRQMADLGARDVEDFICKTAGCDNRGEAVLRNTEAYVAALLADPRYRSEANRAVPKKIGSHLELFDCVTCDKCIPVCPNDANFALPLAPAEIPIEVLAATPAGWQVTRRGTLALARKHQIANVADFCNECGNCDVFCPEDGGPYVVKPRFFVTRAGWLAHPGRDGFFVARETVLARFAGVAYELVIDGGGVTFRGDGFDVHFDPADPGGSVRGRATIEIDLTYYHIMECLRRAVLAPPALNYLA